MADRRSEELSDIWKEMRDVRSRTDILKRKTAKSECQRRKHMLDSSVKNKMRCKSRAWRRNCLIRQRIDDQKV